MAQGDSNFHSPGHIHINRGFQREDETESEESTDLSDDLSETSDENSFDPEWVDKVTSKGELFYVEPTQPTGNGKASLDDSIAESGTVSKLKSQAREKLRRWVHKEEDSNKNSCRSDSISKVTFQASPNGEIKEVVLDIDPRRHNYGRRATLCEALFGIIPSEFNDSVKKGDNYDSRVMVQGFVPNGEALKSGVIKIGDWLKSIDGIEVSMENLSLILGSITTPRKVKLEVQRFAGHSNDHGPYHCGEESAFRVHEVCVKPREENDFCQHIPHILMYLGDGANTDNDEDYIMYKYPYCDSSLLSLNGMFITLNRMVTDITSLPPLCSSVVVDDQLVHVAFHQEERDLMILALPASSTSRLEIQRIVSNIGRLLRWQFQTLRRGFSDKESKDALDQFFHNFFLHYLSPLSNQPNRATLGWSNYFTAVPWLPLNNDLQIYLDNILSEFESGDFGDMSEAYYDTQRLYTILGSCLFYKGVLCASHLTKDDLLDTYWYNFYHRLLRMTAYEEVAQVVVWREVFPTRHCIDSQPSNNTDFRVASGRCFMLAVALKGSLFCSLLEAGGCSLKAEGHPPPDPFYVDQARAVLIKMETMTITSQVESCVESQLAPELVSADWSLGKNKPLKKQPTKDLNMSRSSSLQTLSRKDGLGQRSSSHSSLTASGQWQRNDSGRKKQEVTSILKKRSAADGEKEHLLTPSSPPEGESDGDTIISAVASDDLNPSIGAYDISCQTSASSNSDADSRASYDSGIYRMKSQRIFASSYDLNNMRKCLEELQHDGSDSGSTKLTAGCENVLFQYISVDVAEGVLLTPTEQSQQWLQGPVHKEILKNFQKCVLEIRHVLYSTQKNKEPLCNRELSQFNMDPALAPVKEHGVLFSYSVSPANNNPKKLQPAIDYWVVGRIFNKPEHKEVFVCFQDSSSQNAVELAFKLSFGLLI